MLVEGTLFAAGLVLTFVVGAPIASRAANPNGAWSWLRRAHSAAPERPRVEMTRAFTPLDLGPDPIQWPSQRPWPESPIPTPQWPSQSWDDDHFGARAREKQPQVAPSPSPATAARAGEAEARFFADPELSRAVTPRGAPPAKPAALPTAAPIQLQPATKPAAKGPPKQPPKGPAKPQPQRKPAAASATSGPAPAKPSPSRAASPAVPASAAAPSAGGARGAEAPSREELEAMVAQIGLAGTVQRIMERTGWDFRQSAQYLARVRQGG